MPRVEFEPNTPVYKRAKTVHALHRAATVIGCCKATAKQLYFLFFFQDSVRTEIYSGAPCL
jgi:hypothetical protein